MNPGQVESACSATASRVARLKPALACIEDLGSGLSAIFTLENGFDPATGSVQQATARANNGQGAAPEGWFFGRESWVGLQAPLGRLSLGRQYTIAHTLSGRFQPQSNPNIGSISVFSGHHIARQDT